MAHGKFKRWTAAAALLFTLSLPAVATQTTVDDERGKQQFAKDNAKRAAEVLKDVAEHRKTDGEAWRLLGLALMRAGEEKDARKAFEKAVKLQPQSVLAHTGLALALARLYRTREAERAARQAVALDPNHAEAHYVLGLLLNSTSKFPEAAAEAETALRLKPDSSAALLLYADALMNAFTDAGLAQMQRHPVATLSGDEGRAVLARRDSELEPLKVRLRDAAERLDALAKSKPEEAEASRWRELAEAIRLYARTGSEHIGVFSQSDVTRRALITFKPEPGYTEKARKNNVSGVIRLRAVLAADGSVKHIMVVRGLPDGLTEKAVDSARQIRFTPAMRNGIPVSQFVTLEYNFNVY